tara:strand:- start:4381 stop:4512 length:132 start_codon:yes stop_codon:yes gene_type:complete
MQNTVDHADVKELAELLGAGVEEGVGKEEGEVCGEVCEGGQGK